MEQLGESVQVSCHCGAVRLRVRLSWGVAGARRCDCSFCRRRGAATVSAPEDGIELLQGADALTLYQWGTRTAEHYFCRICGIYTHHRRRSNPREFGINLGCIEGVNPRDLGEIPWTDGVNHPSDRQGRVP